VAGVGVEDAAAPPPVRRPIHGPRPKRPSTGHSSLERHLKMQENHVIIWRWLKTADRHVIRWQSISRKPATGRRRKALDVQGRRDFFVARCEGPDTLTKAERGQLFRGRVRTKLRGAGVRRDTRRRCQGWTPPPHRPAASLVSRNSVSAGRRRRKLLVTPARRTTPTIKRTCVVVVVGRPRKMATRNCCPSPLHRTTNAGFRQQLERHAPKPGTQLSNPRLKLASGKLGSKHGQACPSAPGKTLKKNLPENSVRRCQEKKTSLSAKPSTAKNWVLTLIQLVEKH